jgi:hypothetical protein
MFFIQFYLLLIERSQSGVGVRSGSIQIVTDPDPGSPKNLRILPILIENIAKNNQNKLY